MYFGYFSQLQSWFFHSIKIWRENMILRLDLQNIFFNTNDVNSLSVELSSLYSLRSLMNDDPISIKVSSSWICLLFGRHRDRWALATLSWRDQSQIHEFCKDVDDGFVLARIWTTTVWSGLWIIFLEWWLSRIGIGNRQSRNSNFDLSTSTRPKIPTFSVGFTDFSPGANEGNCWYQWNIAQM